MTAPPRGTVLLLGIHDRPAGRHVHGGVRQGQPRREGGAEAVGALHSDGAGNLEMESLARVSAAMGTAYASKALPEEGVQLLAPQQWRLEEQGHVRGLAVLYPTLARLFLGLGRYAEALAMGEHADDGHSDHGPACSVAAAHGAVAVLAAMALVRARWSPARGKPTPLQGLG
jgi:hypothetical protein